MYFVFVVSFCNAGGPLAHRNRNAGETSRDFLEFFSASMATAAGSGALDL
jgi:hypothetical protein